MRDEFTRKELVELRNSNNIAAKYYGWTDSRLALLDKLNTLIEHNARINCNHKANKESKACELCGLPSSSIPCVGGWL